MWGDELNAFGIAAASPTLGQLLHYVHYEGHPWLWYVVLWLVSRVTISPIGMKVVQGFIGIGIYLLIGLGSPFSRVQKILLFLCYFVSFEYTVLSRMYGLMFLFALLYIRRRALYPQRVVGNAAILGLLASTDMTGIILSIALVCEFVLSKAARVMWNSGGRRKLGAGAAVFVALLLLSVASLVPSKDISTRTTGRMFALATNRTHIAEAVINYTVLPYFPTVTNETLENHARWFEPLVPVVLAAYWIVFRRRRNALVLIGATLLMSVCFADLFYMGGMRHFGITFLAFLAGLWLMRTRGGDLDWAAYALLALTAIGGMEEAVMSWERPFSNVEATATWLKRSHLDRMPMAGTPDGSAAAVAEVLGRSIYMLDCNCRDTFVLFSTRRDNFSEDEIPERLVSAKDSLDANEFVYIQASPMDPGQAKQIADEGFAIQPLAQFTGAKTRPENLYVYRLRFSQGSRAEPDE